MKLIKHITARYFRIIFLRNPIENILIRVDHNNRLAVYFLYRHANICQTARFACLCGFRFGICFVLAVASARSKAAYLFFDTEKADG